MTLDIRGSLKNTKLNSNPYIVFDELFSNAVDSYLIRKSNETAEEPLKVHFAVEFFDRELDGSKVEFKITCTDNGAGLGDAEVKAFVTKDTSYKDDLGIAGIGECKGSGRIQFLHYFSKLMIDSVYIDGDVYKRRTLYIDRGTKEIDENSFRVEIIRPTAFRTAMTLDVIRETIYNRLFADKDLKAIFSAESLKNHIMVSFLPKFVSLKSFLGEFKIKFTSKYKNTVEELILHAAELPEITEKKEIKVQRKLAENDKGGSEEIFCVQHYKLNKNKYAIPQNVVALCAKSAVVKSITKLYLKTKSVENNPINGFYHLILIVGAYLDKHVNEQRDGFDIPIDAQNDEMLFDTDLLSFEEMIAGLDETINKMLTPPDWDKAKIIRKVGEKYGVSGEMIAEANVRIHFGDTEDAVVKRVLTAYQDRIIRDTSDIFDIKQEILRLEPSSPDFRKKVNDIAWKYTSSLKSIDMANLSQLVVRRAAIIETLDVAVKRELDIQNIDDGKRRKDERLIHSIFFPMGRDSHDVTDHDIWLLSEEYHYYDYIASDKALSKIRWNDNQFLFESGIDEELEQIFKKNYDQNAGKRPDIAIFNKGGAAIIIEFKAPSVYLDEHIGDLMEYAQLLAAKSNGRLKRFYGYLLGTHINPNRVVGHQRFPSGRGWFGTADIQEHSTGRRLGELYSELLYYDDITDRARQRLEVYKKRLNFDVRK